MKKVGTVKDLAFETNHHAFNLSAEMMDLEVIQKAIAELNESIEDMFHRNKNEYDALARLSIGEIKDTVRLITMAFHPLFTSLNKSANELNNHSTELLNIVREQENGEQKKPDSAATEKGDKK